MTSILLLNARLSINIFVVVRTSVRKLLSCYLGLKHQDLKDSFCELPWQERSEAFYREVSMTSAHAAVGSGKV